MTGKPTQATQTDQLLPVGTRVVVVDAAPGARYQGMGGVITYSWMWPDTLDFLGRPRYTHAIRQQYHVTLDDGTALNCNRPVIAPAEGL